MQLAAKRSIDYAKNMKGFVTEPKSAYRDAIEGVSGKTMKLIDRLIAEVDGPPLYRVVSRYSAPGMDPPPMDDVLEALARGGSIPGAEYLDTTRYQDPSRRVRDQNRRTSGGDQADRRLCGGEARGGAVARAAPGRERVTRRDSSMQYKGIN
jgi:hypothetical protein